MKSAKQMTDDELAYHLRYYFNHPPAEGLGFVRAFIGKEKRGWKITDKMRFKAQMMVDERFAESDYGSLVEDDPAESGVHGLWVDDHG